MYLKDFMESIRPEAREFLAATIELWSNEAALGYVIAAAQGANLTQAQINTLIDGMEAAFENMTIDEAATYYKTGTY